MSGEWKPGDVAIRSVRRAPDAPSIVVPRCNTDNHARGPHWHHGDGGWDHLENLTFSTFRRVVLIDPEDREQAERLRDLYDAAWVEHHGYSLERSHKASRGNAMQAALRSLVTPPKPEVYEHLAVSDRSGTVRALCGKLWKANDRSAVTVTGKCPECSEMAKGGWVA